MCVHSFDIHHKNHPPVRKSQCAWLYECEWICAYLHRLRATVRYSCVFSFLSENISMWLWATHTHTQALSLEFVRKRKLLLFHMIAKHTDIYIHTHAFYTGKSWTRNRNFVTFFIFIFFNTMPTLPFLKFYTMTCTFTQRCMNILSSRLRLFYLRTFSVSRNASSVVWCIE